MLLEGFALLRRPGAEPSPLLPGKGPAAHLLGPAIVAALWPAAAVLVGNLLAGTLGHDDTRTVASRAAVGMLCAIGGAVVSAPALALLLLHVTRACGESLDVDSACAVALRLVRPAWACGVLAVAPLVAGLGPELAELTWAVAALLVAVFAIRGGVASGLRIRRRWRLSFSLQASLGFAVVFICAVLAPAIGLRVLLGAATPLPLPELNPVGLPWPPPPRW